MAVVQLRLIITVLLYIVAPAISSDVELLYRTENQIRVEWQPYDDERLQHYEV